MSQKNQERPEALVKLKDVDVDIEDVDIEDVEELEAYFDSLTPRNGDGLSSVLSKIINREAVLVKWLKTYLPCCKTVASSIAAGTWEDYNMYNPEGRENNFYQEIYFKVVVFFAKDKKEAFSLLEQAGISPSKNGVEDKERLMYYIVDTVVDENSEESLSRKQSYRDRCGEMYDIILAAIKSDKIQVNKGDFRIPKKKWWEATPEDDNKVGV